MGWLLLAVALGIARRATHREASRWNPHVGQTILGVAAGVASARCGRGRDNYWHDPADPHQIRSIVTKGCEGVYRRVELRRNRISAAGPASAVNAYEPTVIIEHRATRESVIDGHLGVFEQTRV